MPLSGVLGWKLTSPGQAGGFGGQELWLSYLWCSAQGPTRGSVDAKSPMNLTEQDGFQATKYIFFTFISFYRVDLILTLEEQNLNF